MQQRLGIMLQVAGALCFKWWIRTRDVGFVHERMRVEQIQDSGGI